MGYIFSILCWFLSLSQISDYHHLKPATFDGTGIWLDYKAHFDVYSQLNGWTENEKGVYLAVSLRVQAQGVFGNIASKSHDYSELVKHLKTDLPHPIRQNYTESN